jgi:hypothetical protein
VRYLNGGGANHGTVSEPVLFFIIWRIAATNSSASRSLGKRFSSKRIAAKAASHIFGFSPSRLEPGRRESDRAGRLRETLVTKRLKKGKKPEKFEGNHFLLRFDVEQ